VNEPLVSFVTPVYNGERYLAEAIESVLAQTYRNWEYVILDNRSTDRTRELARRYAQREPRIRVVTNDEFLPQIDNWNRSMMLISEESVYTKVLHADDWLYPECVERMVALAEKHPEVGVVSSYRLVGTRVEHDAFSLETKVMPGVAAAAYQLGGGKWIIGTPSSLLLRSSLVREQQPFYETRYLLSDPVAVYRMLEGCDFGFVHQVLSYTRMHDASTTTRSERVGAWNTEITAMTIEYGPRFLDRESYVRRVKSLERRYYWLLLKFVLKGRIFDREVLAYQRHWIAIVSAGLSGQPVRGRWIARLFVRALLSLPLPSRTRGNRRAALRLRLAAAVVFRAHK
jgi:glycosyltransferase involved in cell wall biosynthesis